MNTIMNGRDLALKIKEDVGDDVSSLRASGIIPRLSLILIGNDESSRRYVELKVKQAEKIGISALVHSFEDDIALSEVCDLIKELNRDKKTDGILVQLPIPSHLDELMVVSTISPAKDVDGLTPASLGRIAMGEELYTPAAAGAVIEILNQSNITIHSKKILIGGTSKILALPLANMLINRGGIVTVAPSPNDSFVNYSKVSDIVIVDFGIPKLVKGRMVARGSVIIDSGNNYVDGKVVGDVDIDDVIQKVSMVTPVPGGLGPMLIAVLLKSIVKAANLRSSEHS